MQRETTFVPVRTAWILGSVKDPVPVSRQMLAIGEPGKQIEVQPLRQLPLRSDRVERLRQHRSRQLFLRDAWTAGRRVQLVELTRQRSQRLVHRRPDRPQRMVARNPIRQACM